MFGAQLACKIVITFRQELYPQAPIQSIPKPYPNPVPNLNSNRSTGKNWFYMRQKDRRPARG